MPSQYSDYFDSAEPEPIPDAHPWTYQINGSLERLDRSTGALIQLFRDGSTAYAVHDGDVLASGTSHGSVIQSAIDWVVSNLAESPSNLNTRHIKGWINGGGETYTTSQTIQQKEEVGLCNMDLDANGASLPDGVLRIEPSQDQVDNLGDLYIHNPATRFVRAQNNGGGPGVVSQDQGRGTLTRVIATNNSGDGIVIAGGITVTGYSLYAHSNGGDGVVITDSTNSHGNLNHLYGTVSARNGGHGLHIYKDDQPGDDTDMNFIVGGDLERNTSGVHLGDGARSTLVQNVWTEGNTDSLVVNGPNRTAAWNRIVSSHVKNTTIDNAKWTQIVGCVSPVNYSMDVDITTNAADTYLKNNNINGTLTDNGTDTYREVFGRTSALPMTGLEDVTANRQIGSATWYQNTTSKPLFVKVMDRDSGGGRVALLMHVNSSQSERVVAGNTDDGNGTNESIASVSAVVPPGHHYYVAGNGLTRWVEGAIGGGAVL